MPARPHHVITGPLIVGLTKLPQQFTPKYQALARGISTVGNRSPSNASPNG